MTLSQLVVVGGRTENMKDFSRDIFRLMQSVKYFIIILDFGGDHHILIYYLLYETVNTDLSCTRKKYETARNLSDFFRWFCKNSDDEDEESREVR